MRKRTCNRTAQSICIYVNELPVRFLSVCDLFPYPPLSFFFCVLIDLEIRERIKVFASAGRKEKKDLTEFAVGLCVLDDESVAKEHLKVVGNINTGIFASSFLNPGCWDVTRSSRLHVPDSKRGRGGTKLPKHAKTKQTTTTDSRRSGSSKQLRCLTIGSHGADAQLRVGGAY